MEIFKDVEIKSNYLFHPLCGVNGRISRIYCLALVHHINRCLLLQPLVDPWQGVERKRPFYPPLCSWYVIGLASCQSTRTRPWTSCRKEQARSRGWAVAAVGGRSKAWAGQGAVARGEEWSHGRRRWRAHHGSRVWVAAGEHRWAGPS